MASSGKPFISSDYGDRELTALLRSIQRRLRDVEPVLRTVGEDMLLSTDIRWGQELAPDGTRWKPLAQATIDRKKRLGRILKILQETGTARNSINYRIDGTKLTIGTNLEYMRWHQRSRTFLGFSSDDQASIVQNFSDFITDLGGSPSRVRSLARNRGNRGRRR